MNGNPRKAIEMVKIATGMDVCSSRTQIKNGTIAFRDEELNEVYTIHPKTGYARRKNWYGAHYQLNDKRSSTKTYSYNGTQRTYESIDRVKHNFDYIRLAVLVILGFDARRETVTTTVLKRQYVWDAVKQMRIRKENQRADVLASNSHYHR